VKDHEDNEKVIENLQGLVEEEKKEVSELRNQVKGLELAAKTKDEILAKVDDETTKVQTVFKEIVTKSEEIYQSYKKALATFGGDPLPLPPPAEGPKGVLRMFSWLLSEFEGLQEIAEIAEDNAAAVASEGLMAIMRRAGCADLDRLADRGFNFPSHEELSSVLESVQGLKKAFFRSFWLISGRETVQAIAVAQLEAVSVLDLEAFVFCVRECFANVPL